MLHDILSYAQQIFMAIIAACAPVIALDLLKNTKLKDNEQARAILSMAITRATGLIINQAVIKGTPLIAHQLDIHPGWRYAMDTAGPQLKKLGVTPDELATKISSQLALTLHVPSAQIISVANAANHPQAFTTPLVSNDGKPLVPAIPISTVGQQFRKV